MRKSENGKKKRWSFLPPSWSTMADCHFPISSPSPSVCNRADATHINRISSFYRSRAGFLGSPDFHISPYGQSCCSSSPSHHRPTPAYICLYLFRQLQQLREITGKPCGETEITDVSPACGVEIYGGVAVGSRRMRRWQRRKERIREGDREKDVGGRIDRKGGKEGTRGVWRSKREESLSQSDSDPALLSRHANSTTTG